jgi:ATP-binding cassette subfamily B protein
MSQDTIDTALSIAQADDFVASRKEGLASPVSQGGSNVSGGQRQRLAIARALASDARVLLFDDSFSALDYATDAALRHALNERLSDRSVLIVAQRIATIRSADTILVLDEGRIVGKGTHDELMKSCTTYREIASSQLSASELSGGGVA